MTGVVGAELTESETALRVFLAAGGLILLGVVFLLLTIWWWRSTKPESPALGPLEVMSDRKWVTAAESERRRLIEEHRPEGAAVAYVAPVPVDLSVLARQTPSSFDDLRDPVDPPVVQTLDPEAAELASKDEIADGVTGSGGSAESVSSAGSPVEETPDVERESDALGTGSANGSAVDHVGHGDHGGHGEPIGHGFADDHSSDATTAMTRDEMTHHGSLGRESGSDVSGSDETTAMPSPGQSFVPHAGA